MLLVLDVGNTNTVLGVFARPAKGDAGGGRDDGGMVMVREVAGPDEWEILRDVRLAALRETPSAFGSTYARESAFTEEQWRGRTCQRHGVTYFAYLPNAPEPAGLVGVYVEEGLPDVVSMWVRPVARGNGVGKALISAAADFSLHRISGGPRPYPCQVVRGTGRFPRRN